MDIILEFWISEDYSNSYANLFRTLILAYLLLSASGPGHQTLVGIGEVKVAALIYLGSTLIMLISLFYAASRWGIAGAAAANLWMILLLSYNVLVPLFLGEPISVKHVMMDLFKLIMLPVATYALVVIIPLNIFLRLFITILIILFVLIPIWKDAELKTQIRGLVGGLTSRA